MADRSYSSDGFNLCMDIHPHIQIVDWIRRRVSCDERDVVQKLDGLDMENKLELLMKSGAEWPFRVEKR
jgi:hypothetical protein